MERRTVPYNFLRESLRETRRIRRAIESIRADIQMLHEGSIDEEDEHEFCIQGLEEFTEASYLNLDSNELLALVEKHAAYQDHFIKNIRKLENHIPGFYIFTYFELVRQFDEAVHSIDPDYPVLEPLSTENI